MAAVRKPPHCMATAAAVCCLMLPCGTLSQEASDSGKLADTSITFAVKSLPMTQMLDQLAAKRDFNFIMCESPEPDLTADIALEHPSLKDSLNAICKPFDYTWHTGPSSVMLFECRYTKFNAMPPLTPGKCGPRLKILRRSARLITKSKETGYAMFKSSLSPRLHWSSGKLCAPAPPSVAA